MLCPARGCQHELGLASVRGGLSHGVCPARALRARCRHGVLAKEPGCGRGDRDLRARCDAIDHGASRSGAGPSADCGVCGGAAAEERLVQPGNRPGTAHNRNRGRVSQPAHARAHACCSARRVLAGASRTSPSDNRHSFRPAGPALGWSRRFAHALAQTVAAAFADSAASRRCGRRGAPGRRRRTDRCARRSGRG